MAKHTINIQGSADFSQITKGVEDLQKTINTAFGKNGAKVLDDSSIDFLKSQTNSALSQMTAQLQKLRAEAANFDKLMKSAAGDETKQAALSKSRLDTVKRIADAEKSISNLKRSENTLNLGDDNVIRPTFGGAAARAATTVGNQLPGVREAIGVGEAGLGAGKAAQAQGLGGPAIAALGGLAIAAAAASLALNRASEAFETFKQAVPDLLKLSARGVTPLEGVYTENIANKTGFKVQDVLPTQLEAASAFGTARSPAGEFARTSNLLTAARGMGVEPGQITKAGEQLRQVGGTQVAERQLGSILEKAFTSGLDKSQVPHYLEAAAGLLSTLNQNGIMNSTKLLGVMTSLSKNGMSPEAAAKAVETVNDAISKSQGEANSFFQSAAASRGLGGGTILGTQFAVRQGLQGVDLGALRQQVSGSREAQLGLNAIQQMGLNKGNFGQDFAKSILDQFHQRINTGTKEGAQAGLGFIGQTFGVQTAGEATRVLAILDKIASGTANTKDIKNLQDLQKTPEGKWQDAALSQLDKIALNTEKTAAKQEQAKFELGQAASGVFNTLTSGVTELDQTLSAIFAGKGGEVLSGAAKVTGRQAESAIDSVFGSGASDKAKKSISNGLNSIESFLGMKPSQTSGQAPAAAVAATPGHGVSLDHMLQEQRKTNQILEKGLLRPTSAPKVGRDMLR